MEHHNSEVIKENHEHTILGPCFDVGDRVKAVPGRLDTLLEPYGLSENDVLTVRSTELCPSSEYSDPDNGIKKAL